MLFTTTTTTTFIGRGNGPSSSQSLFVVILMGIITLLPSIQAFFFFNWPANTTQCEVRSFSLCPSSTHSSFRHDTFSFPSSPQDFEMECLIWKLIPSPTHPFPHQTVTLSWSGGVPPFQAVIAWVMVHAARLAEPGSSSHLVYDWRATDW